MSRGTGRRDVQRRRRIVKRARTRLLYVERLPRVPAAWKDRVYVFNPAIMDGSLLWVNGGVFRG